ncbi:MAG: pitrilysin family protein [Bacteroidota bacterium]|jgi:predicted Zn-dependent peptidase
MQKILILILVLFTFHVSHGQARKIEFVEYDLDNGLHVILHQDNTTPIVAVTVLYHVGSKNEDPNRTGFAHFFEHLLFEGSENIGRGEIDKYIRNAGGVLNAYTMQDRTFYHEVLPSNQLALGLWIESERMLHAKIDSIGVETQREVVKEEKRQRIDNQPYMSFQYELFRRAFKVHPYRWITIGSLDHLNEATLDEFIDFYKTFYVPQNATLSIAGDINIDETKKLIDLYFKDIPRGSREIPRPTVVEPPQQQEIRDVIYDNIQLPAVFQGYHIPADGTEEAYAVDMLNRLLSGGQSSRMYKALVDEQKKALAVQAFPYPLTDPGLYIVLALPNVGVDINELEKAMDAEIEKVKTDLISESEFQKIRNQVESQFVQQNSSMAGIAEQLAIYHTHFGDANLINTEIERYMKVTREDIRRVAQKYLTKENRVVLHYLPKSAQNNPASTQSEKE